MQILGSPLGIQSSFPAFVESELILLCSKAGSPGRKERKKYSIKQTNRRQILDPNLRDSSS